MATGFGLAGGIIGALGILQRGRFEKSQAESAANIANYNAAVAKQTAKAIELKTKFQQKRQAEAALRVRKTLRARMGKAGALPDVGTPLLLAGEQAEELELENLLIGFEGQTEAARARTQATLDRLQADLFKEKGRAAKELSKIEALSFAAGAGRTAFKSRPEMGQPLLTGFSSVRRTPSEDVMRFNLRDLY